MSIFDDLLKGYETGNFIGTICSLAKIAKGNEDNDLIIELVTLHNEGEIDVIVAFDSLESNLLSGRDLFIALDTFSKVLPNLNSPVRPVIQCVLNLNRCANQSYSGSLIEGYINFCAKELSRPIQALAEIEENPEFLAVLLPATIIAGSRIDFNSYLAKAIRLCEYKSSKMLLRQAIFAIGKLDWTNVVNVPNSVFNTLESIAEFETDDEILANIIECAFALLQRDKAQESRVVEIIITAMTKGGEFSLHAASKIFCSNLNNLPDSLLSVLFNHLTHVNPKNTGTLHNLDEGIYKLFKKGIIEATIQFFESLLLANSNVLSMEDFKMTAEIILNTNELLSKVLTRWFLLGDSVLCEGVCTIIGSCHVNDLLLYIDSTELPSTDSKNIVFIARKAIGYLFMQPISAVSILISLMRHTTDYEVLDKLGALLFSPMFINYPGKTRDYVIRQKESESSNIKEILELAINSIDEYLDDLKAIGNLVALHPGEAQKETYYRFSSQQMEESQKAAEAQSIFTNIFSKELLLYGRKSITYIYGSDGEPHRTELPLQSHSFTIEYPRMENIDPFGLNYMLHIFRNEKLTV